MSDRRDPAPKAPVPAPAVPTAAESWERHARIAELVKQIRKTRGLRLSPAPPPRAR